MRAEAKHHFVLVNRELLERVGALNAGSARSPAQRQAGALGASLALTGASTERVRVRETSR
jgi:hypothetical protein